MARESCFKCWHCRRVEGLSSVCVCVVNVSKGNKPEFIEEPSKGDCVSFYSREIVKTEVIHYLQETNLEEKRKKGYGPRLITEPDERPDERGILEDFIPDDPDGYPNLFF